MGCLPSRPDVLCVPENSGLVMDYELVDVGEEYTWDNIYSLDVVSTPTRCAVHRTHPAVSLLRANQIRTGIMVPEDVWVVMDRFTFIRCCRILMSHQDFYPRTRHVYEHLRHESRRI